MWRKKKISLWPAESGSLAGIRGLVCWEVLLSSGGWPMVLHSETCLRGKPHTLPVGSLTKNCSDFPRALPQCLWLHPRDQAGSFSVSLGLSGWAGPETGSGWPPASGASKEGAGSSLAGDYPASVWRSSPHWYPLVWLNLTLRGFVSLPDGCDGYTSSAVFVNFIQCPTLNSPCSPCMLQGREDGCLLSSSLCL